MNWPFVLLIGLLLSATALFWVKWRPGQAPPPELPGPDKLPPGGQPADEWRGPPAPPEPVTLSYPEAWQGGSLADAPSWSALRLRALLIRLCSRHSYEEALTASQRLEADFTDGDRFRQAVLLAQCGHQPEALAEYDRLLDRPNPMAIAYNNRGYTQSLLGNYAAALPDFDQAIELDACRAFAYNNRGLARLRLDYPPAEARADILKSLRLNVTNAYAHCNLGIWHYEQQQWQPALACLEQAHALGPDTPKLD